MLLSSKGIVLQSLNYGDNSIISKVFSEEKGLVTLIHSKKKGKRKGQSNYFLPFAAIQFVCYVSNKSTIYRVKEVSFNEVVPPPSDRVIPTAIRFFLAEVLNRIIKEEEQNISLYRFLEKKSVKLELEDIEIASFHILFLIELLEAMGINPAVDPSDSYFDYREGHSVIDKPLHIEYCAEESFHLLCELLSEQRSLTKAERRSLLQTLLSYYQVQLGVNLENLKSKQVLEVVFA